MSKEEKKELLEKVAALPQEVQRNLSYFVAGYAASNEQAEKKDPPKDK